MFVDVETGVHTAIRKVRQALSDSPEAPTCVETVPGKGYRFIAPVEILPTSEPAPAVSGARPSRTRRAGVPRLVAAATARGRAGGRRCRRGGSGAARRPSRARVTVRRAPLREPERRRRARVPRRRPGRGDHRVVRTDRSRPPQRHRPHLDPGLQAHPEVAGRDRPRAGRRLPDGGIDPSGGYGAAHHVRAWSACATRRRCGRRSTIGEPTSVLGLQREISTAIAEQIQLRLSPERLDALARRHTRNADAYDLYLRGRFLWNQLKPATNSGRSSTTSARSRSTRTTRSRGPASPTPWRPARSTATCPPGGRGARP